MKLIAKLPQRTANGTVYSKAALLNAVEKFNERLRRCTAEGVNIYGECPSVFDTDVEIANCADKVEVACKFEEASSYNQLNVSHSVKSEINIDLEGDMIVLMTEVEPVPCSKFDSLIKSDASVSNNNFSLKPRMLTHRNGDEIIVDQIISFDMVLADPGFDKTHSKAKVPNLDFVQSESLRKNQVLYNPATSPTLSAQAEEFMQTIGFEVEKFNSVLNHFNATALQRFSDKVNQGRYGWDDPKNYCKVIEQLYERMHRPLRQATENIQGATLTEKYKDVAILAIMVWWQSIRYEQQSNESAKNED